MYRKINDFLEDFKTESEGTIKIFNAVSEEEKSKKLTDYLRSLERLAWHITQTVPEMGHKSGILAFDDLENKPIPAEFKEIINLYEEQIAKFEDALEKKWSDNDLDTVINMYGENWKKGRMLSILLRHQAHHRGQMTAIMRSLGLVVPGIYGPSREEWIKYGMPAME